MNIEVSQKEKIIDHQCISCYECTSERNCPINDTVNFEAFKTTLIETEYLQHQTNEEVHK
jgi:heterodisulfide reductase subunit A-like polyferredoxin